MESIPAGMARDPPLHVPFTGLSPTVEPQPSPAKRAKGKVVADFMASGYLAASAASGRPKITEEQVVRPNPFDISLRVTNEPGLNGWWSGVISVLKDSFRAERAILSVPSDGTEVENVPWALLATYNNAEDVGQSRDASDSYSTISSVIEATDSPGPEKRKEYWSQAVTRALASGESSTHSNLSVRPGLSSRHSYAGYPLKQQLPSRESLSSLDESVRRPIPSRTTSQKSVMSVRPLTEKNELGQEPLRRLETEESASGRWSEDTTYGSSRGSLGRVVPTVQSLESEIEPLITTAGIVRVLRNSNAMVLTRKYADEIETKESGKQNVGKSLSSKLLASGVQSSTEQARSPDGRASPQLFRQNRGGMGVNLSTSSKLDGHRSQVFGPPTYEDFEQVPGTPWAQSPAPSPAALADTKESPFFRNVIDETAFAKNPPAYQYYGGQFIEAIGLDKSASIIQIPLIHPSASISQTLRSKRLRHKVERGMKAPESQQPLAQAGDIKKIPIAILSLLAPTVPYPADLVDSLNEIAPLLATSFYAARQHSTIQTELAALSRKGNRNGLLSFSRGYRTASEISGATTNDITRTEIGRLFSPTSTSSTSTSDFPTPSQRYQSSTGGATTETPGWISSSNSIHQTPGFESRESYFAFEPSKVAPIGENLEIATKPTPAAKSTQQTQSTGPQKRKVLHSQGASFQNTNPSLPKSTGNLPSISDDSVPVDMSEKIAEEFREPSLSMLKTMIDNGATQQFIAEVENGTIVWANSKFLAYRNTPGENIHDQLWNNIHPKDRKNFQKEWTNALHIGEQLSYQLRLKRFDGHYRWFHIRFLPLKDRHGATKYWHGQAMDIHELHEAEVKAAKSKEKAASEARYRAIANSLPVIVFAASVSAGMTFANTQWLSYSGQNPAEALGFGFLDHVHPEDLTKCRFPGFDGSAASTPKAPRPLLSPLVRTESATSSAAESEETTATEATIRPRGQAVVSSSADLQIPNELLKKLAQDGIVMCARDGQGNLSITTEMRLKSRDNDYCWHLVQGSYIEPVNFGAGEAQWFIACTDISSQKQTEASIQKANSKLETVNTALEEEMKRKMGYLSSMSHEIRTPLNGIIGNLQFLINSGLDDSAADWAHGAQEAAKSMHDLINDILDLSKAEAKMLKLSSHWFNPRTVMEEVMDLLNSRVSEKKLELVNECNNNVPLQLRGDSGRIRQVLLNLAGNAIKFTRKGEISLKCNLLDKLPPTSALFPANQNEIFVRWTVTDTGTGFTEEGKKLLFKPYSQIKNRSTRDIGGTGLGLILCKTMVELHGGEISASSEPGSGSVFTFFARFRTKKKLGHSASHSESSVPRNFTPSTLASTPQSSTTVISPLELPRQMPSIPRTRSQDSPALLSDSSSAPSIQSQALERSLQSSISTTHSSIPDAKLAATPVAQGLVLTPESLPTNTSSPSSPRRTSHPPLSPKPIVSSSRASSVLTGPSTTRRADATHAKAVPKTLKGPDLERSNFRPPMLSVLVVCPYDNTCRITTEQIQEVAPRSAACNIISRADSNVALNLMFGDDPVTFTHVVVRVTQDEVVQTFVRRMLDSTFHTNACLLIITDPNQVKALKAAEPDVDFDELSKTDRIKILLRPAHTSKLAKIFDPFNENAARVGDPKATKRLEENRLQREAYALFKRVMGGARFRIIAVEDNKLQMNVSVSGSIAYWLCSCLLDPT